jgi:hypothetical protein
VHAPQYMRRGSANAALTNTTGINTLYLVTGYALASNAWSRMRMAMPQLYNVAELHGYSARTEGHRWKEKMKNYADVCTLDVTTDPRTWTTEQVAQLWLASSGLSVCHPLRSLQPL